MVDLARENRAQTAANQQNLLAESYYGLRLAQQVVAVREETYRGLQNIMKTHWNWKLPEW